MSLHIDDYHVPFCGGSILLGLHVRYTWNDDEGSRETPSYRGAEIDSIKACVGDDFVTLIEWPDELVLAIQHRIAKEHAPVSEECE